VLAQKEKQIQELNKRLNKTLTEGAVAETEGVDASVILPPAEVNGSLLEAVS
jgi:hypothetical protein